MRRRVPRGGPGAAPPVLPRGLRLDLHRLRGAYAAVAEGLDAGFSADAAEQPDTPLVILYAHDLEAMEAKVRGAGGLVTRPIFAFPGGRRFHFRDPSGNELAVWSEA